ncbi:MAG: hypothetical protein ACTII7_04725 [Galactobacter sp.]
MTPTTAQVLQSAMALSPDERVALATELLRSAGTQDAARLESLRKDVAVGFEQIDRGDGIELEEHEIRDYIRGLGREASERVAGRNA